MVSTAFVTSLRTPSGRALVHVMCDALDMLEGRPVCEADRLSAFARHAQYIDAVARRLYTECDGPVVTVDSRALRDHPTH